MFFFDRLLSLFSGLRARTHAQVKGTAVDVDRTAAGTTPRFEPIEVQMAREMDEFDRAHKGVIRHSDISDARAAILAGMPEKYLLSFFGEAVLERARASLQQPLEQPR